MRALLTAATLFALFALLAGAALAGTPAQKAAVAAGAPAAPVQPIDTSLGAFINQDVAIGTETTLAGGTASKSFTVFWWAFGVVTSTEPTLLNGYGPPFFNSLATHCEVNAGTSPGACLSVDNSTLGNFNFNNSVGVTHSTDAIQISCNNTAACFPLGKWNFYMVSVNAATGAYAVVVNGVNKAGSLFSSFIANTTPDFFDNGIHLLNGPGLSTADTGYLADVYINTHENAVCTGAGAPATMFGYKVTCAAANTIPPEVLARAYRSGQPVSQGPTGSYLTNDQPELYLTGNGPALETNLGKITTPLAAETVTTGGYVSAAPYGPSGIPAHQVTLRWMPRTTITWATSGCTNSWAACGTTNADGQPISPGDLVVLVSEVGNSSGTTNYGLQCPTGGADTWHQIGPLNDTSESVNSEVCWTVAQSGDVGGAWTWGTTRTGAGVRTHQNLLLDYRCGSATPACTTANVDQTGSKLNTSTTSPVTAAGLSTTAANETVLSILVHWEASHVNAQPPAADATRYRNLNCCSVALTMATDQYGVASGTNPQKTFGFGAADTAAGYTITMVPN